MFNVIRPSDKVHGDKFKETNDVPRKPVGRPSLQHSNHHNSYDDDNDNATDPIKHNTTNNTARPVSNYRFDK